MSRTVTADGVDFELRRPKYLLADMATRMLLQGVSLLVAAGVGVLSGPIGPLGGPLSGLWSLLLGCALFVAGSAAMSIWHESRWASDRVVRVSLRSWGIEIAGDRLPWDAIEGLGTAEQTFSIVTRAGRHHVFQNPGGGVVREFTDAFDRGGRVATPLDPSTVQAMGALRGRTRS